MSSLYLTFHLIGLSAGSAVDDFINQLTPLLSKGDIIIDGGNSEYTDTQRRCKNLASKGFLFIGAGVKHLNSLFCKYHLFGNVLTLQFSG